MRNFDTKIDAADFYREACDFVAAKNKHDRRLETDNLRRVCNEDFSGLSRRLDKNAIQDSASVRNNLRTRRLANLLIDDKGVLNKAHLKRAISLVEENHYFVGPGRDEESFSQEHLLRSLKRLLQDKRLVQILQSIPKPHFHQYADDVIRSTLQMPQKSAVSDAHARRAALAAWLCNLRQTLGSCFATAPAILVHDEMPEYFFENIRELFSTGQIKRTFGGIEYAVPFSTSWGPGDLKRSFLLPGDPAAAADFLEGQPGLIAAFEGADLIDAEATTAQKRAALATLIYAIVERKKLPRSSTIKSSPLQLIEETLQQLFSITEQDLADYHDRPRTMLQGSLLMQTPKSGSTSGGIGQACAGYTLALEKAKIDFKCLTDNALLKSWEFTVASFAETKAEFARWNFYSSLGLRSDEPGGIGPALFAAISDSLDGCNKQVEEFHEQYNQLYLHVKAIESRMRNAASEEELRWQRIDYQAKTSELSTIMELRDGANAKAQRYAYLFQTLIDSYIDLFPRYFQEIYDAEMIDIGDNFYDDSPAGFHLLYKHGRSNTAQWTPITNHREFIEALASFFMAAERELEREEEFAGLEQDLSQLTTAIVTHIRSDEFIESAFHRMAIAHNTRPIADPLHHMDKVEKKPWVYTSGGNINTLLSCYFRREEPPTEQSTWVENPVELIVFLVDSIKQLHDKELEPFRLDPNKGMLMHSPTHAFVLKPGMPLFREAWESHNSFTYTWLRDNIIQPMEYSVNEMRLNELMMGYLVKQILDLVPAALKPAFKQKFGSIKGSLAPEDFSRYIYYSMEEDPQFSRNGRTLVPSAAIDSVLFSHLPLLPHYLLKDHISLILNEIPSLSKEVINHAEVLFDQLTPRMAQDGVFSCQKLQQIVLSLIALTVGKTSFAYDYAKIVKTICLKHKLSLPEPLLFADTNWQGALFAIIVNPGSGKAELWRVDRLANTGAPMSHWSQWIDGSRQSPKWAVFPNIVEYKA